MHSLLSEWLSCVSSLAHSWGRSHKPLPHLTGSSLPIIHQCHVSIPSPRYSSLIPLLPSPAQSLFNQNLSSVSLLLPPDICSLFFPCLLHLACSLCHLHWQSCFTSVFCLSGQILLVNCKRINCKQNIIFLCNLLFSHSPS